MDTEAKERIRQAMRSQVHGAEDSSQASLRSEHSAAEIDPDSSYSIDDLSQSDDEGQFVGLYERVEAGEAKTLTEIDALDLSHHDVVGPGAIVEMDGLRYVIGVALSEFDVDGDAYVGIATDSPLYAQMAGLRADDTFDFRGVGYRIASVW